MSGENSSIHDGETIGVHVAVGSGNPCKIEAVRSAFEQAFGSGVTIIISSYNVPSNVSDQPMGTEETKRGAMNRARAAFAMANATTPDFAVGLEGGLVMETTHGEPPQNQDAKKEEDTIIIPTLWCMAWMAILGSDSSTCTLIRADNQNDMSDSAASSTSQPQKYRDATKEVWGFAQTGHFALPPQVARLVVKEGMELGDADDQVFDRTNGKHGSGTVGILTNGMIDRANYYDHALKLALTPWIRPDLYIPSYSS